MVNSTELMYRFECLKLAAENIPEEFYCPECVVDDAKEYMKFLFSPKDETKE